MVSVSISTVFILPYSVPSAEGQDSHHQKKKSPGYDTKLSDGETPVMLELWGIQITPSSPLLPGPLWPGVVLFIRVLSMGQIELFENDLNSIGILDAI